VWFAFHRAASTCCSASELLCDWLSCVGVVHVAIQNAGRQRNPHPLLCMPRSSEHPLPFPFLISLFGVQRDNMKLGEVKDLLKAKEGIAPDTQKWVFARDGTKNLSIYKSKADNAKTLAEIGLPLSAGRTILLQLQKPVGEVNARSAALVPV
jgi:hypothetical protein